MNKHNKGHSIIELLIGLGILGFIVIMSLNVYGAFIKKDFTVGTDIIFLQKDYEKIKMETKNRVVKSLTNYFFNRINTDTTNTLNYIVRTGTTTMSAVDAGPNNVMPVIRSQHSHFATFAGYIYPDTAKHYTMEHLVGFMPTVSYIRYSGYVDANDVTVVKWAKYPNRVVMQNYNSEDAAPQQALWVAIWAKPLTTQE